MITYTVFFKDGGSIKVKASSFTTELGHYVFRSSSLKSPSKVACMVPMSGVLFISDKKAAVRVFGAIPKKS